MDSSLILLAIIALTGAYLLPHAVRRREQLSAARATDRFSTAMRVLARRPQGEARSRLTAHSRSAAPALLSSPRLEAPRADAAGGRAWSATMTTTTAASSTATSSSAAKQARPQGPSRRSRVARWSACLLMAASALLAAAVTTAGALGRTSDLGPRLGVEMAPLWWVVAGAGQLVVVVTLLRLRARRRATRRRAAVRLVPLPGGRSLQSTAPAATVGVAQPVTVGAPPVVVTPDEPELALRPA